MRAAMGSAKLAQLKDKADKHTLYIFGRGYTREKLPTWSTHPMARQQELEEGSAVATYRRLQVEKAHL